MTDKNDDVLDFNAFNLLMKAAWDLDNFNSHKFSYIQGPELSDQQKKRHTDKKRKLAASADRFLPLIRYFFIKTSKTKKILDAFDQEKTLDILD